MSKQQDLIDQFVKTLQEQLEDTGREFERSAREVAEYAGQRAAHLSTLVGDHNFGDAVIAERDNVALVAGIKAVDSADRVDTRIAGIVQGSLALGARLLGTV